MEVRFSFDTIDGFANGFLGWMVDDVTIHACPVFGGSGMAGTAAEARATAEPMVICEDAGTRLDVVGPTLRLASDGTDLTFHWDDVAGAADYVVLAGTVASIPPATEVGSAGTGSTGLTVPLPVGDVLFFRVAGRNSTCGLGPLQ